jgi:hypothetical protein
MMDMVWVTRITLCLINLVLLLMLISIYVNEYKRLNSIFTLGFLIFVLALFFRTLFSAPIIDFLFLDIRASSPFDPYRIIGDVTELFALLILLFISTREAEKI